MSDLFIDDIGAYPDRVKAAREWIAALRSGAYQQTRGMLHERGGGFCCLGVACDLYDPNSWALPEDQSRTGLNFIYPFDGESESAYWDLPEPVVDALGLRDGGGEGAFLLDGASTCLSRLNDDGASFGRIADIIERELEEALGQVAA